MIETLRPEERALVLGLSRDWRAVARETPVALLTNLRKAGLVETKRDRLGSGRIHTWRARLSPAGVNVRAQLARSAH